jgi:hypothetical protein
MYYIDFLKTGEIVFKFNMTIAYIVFFWILKNMSTFTFVNSVQIDEEKKEIIVDYLLWNISKKKCIIPFEEFTFYTQKDLLFWGASKSIRIYKDGIYKIKLNARNNWKKEQIEELEDICLDITNNELRKKPWYSFFT